MIRFTSKSGPLVFGVFFGIAYGALTRFIFQEYHLLNSLGYLLGIPAVLGILPLIFMDDEQIKRTSYVIFTPLFTIIGVYAVFILVGWEDVICLLIFSLPFAVASTAGALIYQQFRLKRTQKKAHALSLLLLPLLVAPIENQVASPANTYSVISDVVTVARPQLIWSNIVRVPKIAFSEYSPGFFNKAGVPRPLEAELSFDGIGAVRHGHFDEGLTFVERIREWQPPKRVAFGIEVDPRTIPNQIIAQHILKGNYFKFLDAAYQIDSLSPATTRLRLTSRYTLTSKLNFYERFWADWILSDFQDRLLRVLKARCESKTVPIQE
jgi:hypothetical protein